MITIIPVTIQTPNPGIFWRQLRGAADHSVAVVAGRRRSAGHRQRPNRRLSRPDGGACQPGCRRPRPGSRDPLPGRARVDAGKEAILCNFF